MQVLIVRHGKSEDRDQFKKTGKPDSLRPLTKKGITQFFEAAQGLHKIVGDLDTLYSSEYKRAAQTAEILSGEFPDAKFKKVKTLNQGQDIKKMQELIKHYQGNGTVALVGHNPDLSQLVTKLAKRDGKKITLKKGGAALFKLKNGKFSCEWTKTQKELREEIDTTLKN